MDVSSASGLKANVRPMHTSCPALSNAGASAVTQPLPYLHPCPPTALFWGAVESGLLLLTLTAVDSGGCCCSLTFRQFTRPSHTCSHEIRPVLAKWCSGKWSSGSFWVFSGHSRSAASLHGHIGHRYGAQLVSAVVVSV